MPLKITVHNLYLILQLTQFSARLYKAPTNFCKIQKRQNNLFDQTLFNTLLSEQPLILLKLGS